MLTQHADLQKDQVGQGRKIFEPLPCPLGKETELLSHTEKAVRHIECDKLFTSGRRKVKRPASERPAGLDKLGDRDVQHALAAGLRAGHADRETLDQGRALTWGPRELVAIHRVTFCYSLLAAGDQVISA